MKGSPPASVTSVTAHRFNSSKKRIHSPVGRSPSTSPALSKW